MCTHTTKHESWIAVLFVTQCCFKIYHHIKFQALTLNGTSVVPITDYMTVLLVLLNVWKWMWVCLNSYNIKSKCALGFRSFN